MAGADSQKNKGEKHPGGRPLKFKSLKELQAGIDAYFKQCDENVVPWFDFKTKETYMVPKPIPYTVTGLAIHLGTNRQTLLNYQEREEFFDAIRAAKLKCENYAEISLWEPKIATGVIFNLKNNHGWKEGSAGENGQPIVIAISEHVAGKHAESSRKAD